jgi:hypothetical protein
MSRKFFVRRSDPSRYKRSKLATEARISANAEYPSIFWTLSPKKVLFCAKCDFFVLHEIGEVR